jgi:hypothetical protein
MSGPAPQDATTLLPWGDAPGNITTAPGSRLSPFHGSGEWFDRVDPYSKINETHFSLRTIGPLQQLFAQFTSA